MRRLFWVGVGVVVTVVVVRQGRRLVVRYTPQAVADRAGRAAQDAGRAAETFLGAFRGEFVAARDRREAELTAALLADGQPDPQEVRASGLRPGDLRPDRSRPRHAADPEGARAAGPAGRTGAGPDDPDDDEAELGYSF